ncbi:hypothetical protein OG497_37770 [Streptomyces sp. NBC_01242]|uniref:hypothetical protein n=1 Tax=Streptomyces sp. NBC_01242 TaxID=2903795 RepID=UPI00224DB932|nr:hypothetical protein [Streptomyces sp. NBC_01242]MCX4799607.1 hypothetical protein [Streptomyces sp. NBC_01242]
MKVTRHTVAAALAVCALAALTACGPESTQSAPPENVASAPSPSASTESPDEALKRIQEENEKNREKLRASIEAAASKNAAAAVETANLPNLVGMNHQGAQNAAQAAGFYHLDEKDGSGQERLLIWDRNWKVCAQEPAPGRHGVDVTVTLTSVKLAESC